jgi:hypothetical protein
LKVSIWLDDYRNPNDEIWSVNISSQSPCTEEVVWVKNYDQFVEQFQNIVYHSNDSLESVFFDHHLGEDLTGYQAILWMKDEVFANKLSKFNVFTHTSDPDTRFKIKLVIAELRRYWRHGANGQLFKI